MELTDAEVAQLLRAERLDSGALAERLADEAERCAMEVVGSAEWRELAGLALALARRVDASADSGE
jgi:hypothetical protein